NQNSTDGDCKNEQEATGKLSQLSPCDKVAQTQIELVEVEDEKKSVLDVTTLSSNTKTEKRLMVAVTMVTTSICNGRKRQKELPIGVTVNNVVIDKKLELLKQPDQGTRNFKGLSPIYKEQNLDGFCKVAVTRNATNSGMLNQATRIATTIVSIQLIHTRRQARTEEV
ncbi:unnamed protein product, partial [Dovyalis caffra]